MEIETHGYDEYRREQIKKARQVNLASYLITIGEPLECAGVGRYRHREHDSLVFTDGKGYLWNSRELNGKKETGNAIDYLMRHKGMDFTAAVFELNNTVFIADERETTKKLHEPFLFTDIKFTPDMRQTIAYLNKSRGISYELIKNLIIDKFLFQEAETNNIIFPMYDETGDIVGAELCGTLTDKRFKGIKANSEYGYGYSIQGKAEIKYALFFESAIDVLSFVDIERVQNKVVDNMLLVSMSGLKDVIIRQTLNRRNEALQAVLCVDNDSAGDKFIKSVATQISGVKTYLPESQYKDWNEQLQAMKKNIPNNR